MNFFYFFGKALKNIIRNFSLNLFTIVIIISSLAIFNLFLFISYNVNLILSDSQQNKIIVYLEIGVEDKNIEKYKEEILKDKNITEIKYTNQKDSFDKFKKSLNDEHYLLEGIDNNIIPPYFEILLKKDCDIEKTISTIKELYFVSSIDYGKEIFEKIENIGKFLHLILWYIAFFIMMATIFAIYMTIKITIYSRKDEIEILELVGATRFFIKMPFHIEGIFQGLFGAIFSVFLVYMFYSILGTKITSTLLAPIGIKELYFLPMSYILFNLLFGSLLGFLASYFAVSRFLKI